MAWAWACLQCNDTWGASIRATHSCTEPLEYLRAFWTARLRWAPPLRGKSDAEIRAVVCKPLARTMLVALLGPSWDPAGDDGSRMSLHKPREAPP